MADRQPSYFGKLTFIPGMTHDFGVNLNSHGLVRHIIHLNNTLLSQFGAWLSLEALYCDSAATDLAAPNNLVTLVATQLSMMENEYCGNGALGTNYCNS
jgi:hypothetical protein